MAQVRFIPEPGTPAVQSQFGIEWGPEFIEVTDEKVLAKVRNNPFYEVVEGGKAKPANNPPPPPPPGKAGYRAKHEAGGRYIIVFGDEDEKVAKGLTKEDAEAFNALSDEEKAAKVDALKQAAT